MPVLAAGGAFAGCTLAGLLAGIWLDQRSGRGLWVLAGLLGGMALGAYSAFRLVMQSL
jgi:uncharacterized protein YneF (UPF0154 family)